MRRRLSRLTDRRFPGPSLFPRPSRVARGLALAALGAALLGGPATAQVIPVKTIPLATGDQFLVQASSRMGMAGVRAAVDDTVADPFVHPAKGARVSTGRILAAPTFYSVGDGNGSGRTLPLAALFDAGRWFGGLSVAIQELVGPERTFRDFAAPTADPLPGFGTLLDERSTTNTYLSGLVGRRLGSGWAAGAGVSWADLGGVDGVEHLYPRARRLEQSGTVLDYRGGLIRDPEDGARLELLLLHRRFSARHDVESLELVQLRDARACHPEVPCWTWRPVTEVQRDRTNTTGVHLGADRELDAPGWRLGGFTTVNYKDHPHIPDYDLMNIPRDPGTTWAWNLGVGVARSRSGMTLALDVVFEPVWTETWAEAAEPTPAEGGRTIPAGDRTVDNDFFFRNVDLRLGGAHRIGPAELQAGLHLRSVRYELEQVDHVRSTERVQDESWMEWRPTWGGSVDLESVVLRYQGALTTGTGRPGVAPRFGTDAGAADGGIDFVPAPEGPLTLRDARVWTHQVSVEVPVR